MVSEPYTNVLSSRTAIQSNSPALSRVRLHNVSIFYFDEGCWRRSSTSTGTEALPASSFTPIYSWIADLKTLKAPRTTA